MVKFWRMLASPVMWSETLDSTIHDPDFCLGVAKSLSEWPFSARELVPMTEFWDKLACVKVFLESLQLFLSEGVALGIEHWSLVEVAAAVPRLCLGLQFRGFPWRSRHLPFVCPIFRQCSHLGFFFFFFCLGWNLNSHEQPMLKCHWLMNQASLFAYFLHDFRKDW